MKKKISEKGILITACLFAFALLLSTAALYIYGTGEEGVRHFNRYNARLSFAIFTIVFALPGIKYIAELKFYNWIEANQRYFMLAMILIMLIHLGGIYSMYEIRPSMPKEFSTFAGGGIAYLMIFLLFLFPRTNENIQNGNRILNSTLSVGIYWIWFIFAFTYIGRISRSLNFIPFAIFTFALLFFRIWGMYKNKKN